MRWDEILERLDRNGHSPEELDFMDNYGPIVREEHPALRGRHLRCVLGVARIENRIRFEAYLFSSSDYAEEFLVLVNTSPGWSRVHNLVVHAEPANLGQVESVLREAVGQEARGR
jgi:hypothetical protein